jgi:hypothetical protein
MLRIRKLLVIVPLMILALTTAAPVSATPSYPPVHHGKLKVSATHVRPGQAVRATGSGFAKRTKVSVRLTCRGRTSVRGPIRANSRGVAATTVKLWSACTWTIRFTGRDARHHVRVLSARVVVTKKRAHAAPTAQIAAAPVASTSSALTPLWAGMGLVVAGGTLLGTMRMRRRVRP